MNDSILKRGNDNIYLRTTGRLLVCSQESTCSHFDHTFENLEVDSH